MSKISAKAKQAIIEKVLARDGSTISEIAEAHNSGYSTLQKWLKKSRTNAIVAPVKPRTNSQTLSLSERLQHLMATAALDETALGVYCREHGIYAICSSNRYAFGVRAKISSTSNVSVVNIWLGCNTQLIINVRID